MKRWAALLLLTTPVVAQGMFDPPSPRLYRAYPGARERYAESLALLKVRLEADFTQVADLERLAELTQDLGRGAEFIASLRVIALSKGLHHKDRSRLRGLLGHVLVTGHRMDGWVQIIQGGMRIRIGNSNPTVSRKAYLEAVPYLRGCIQDHPEDVRAREDLAKALEGLNAADNKEEVEELRRQAGALRLRQAPPVPPRIDTSIPAQQMRERAEQLEQRESGPDHTTALALRKQALVLVFCTETIPFTYEPGGWLSVAQLAPESLVQEYLTRTFTNTLGDIDAVPAHYQPTAPTERLRILRTLAADKTAQSTAVLFALFMQNRYADYFADEAVAVLAAADNPAAAEHLPRLLRTELFTTGDLFRPFAVRRLVALAAAMKLQAAAPALVQALPLDRKLDRPLYIARALGNIGRAEDAAVLLAYAKSADHDVWGRREAVAALGRLQPDQLAALVDDALLEIAVAGARYRIEPSEALRGRILAGFGRLHEVDEAAALCIEFQIVEAIPLLDDLIEANKHPYAIDGAKAALKKLRDRARGS